MIDEQDFRPLEEAVYEMRAQKAAESLNRVRINAQYAKDRKAALAMVIDMIPEGAVVGTADSMTLVQTGVFSALKKRGKNEIINPFIRDRAGNFVLEMNEVYELMRRVFLSDVFVIGTNAITLDGKLVNTDGTGNRVSAMIFGPRKVIIMAGANKIVKDLDEAMQRIRNYCAPHNALKHATLYHRTNDLKLPCAKTGICTDCNHPGRICHYTTIIEGVKEEHRGRINVVLVGEKLGI